MRWFFIWAFSAVAAWAEPTYLGTYHWTYEPEYFGGFSGIEVDANGIGFLVIGDAGQIIKGKLIRTDGHITGVDFDNVKGLKTPVGQRVTGPDEFDAEGLALLPDGRFFVAFEGVTARVWAYAQWQGPAAPLPGHPDFSRFGSNRGPEALAVGPDNVLYAIPERPTAFLADRHVYRFDGTWQTFGSLETDGFFWPTGADIGPDGRLYLLERRYIPLAGFSSRIRRFRIGPTGLESPEILLQTGFGTHDNLEGIAVWEDAEGRIGLTMISDDNNRRRAQRTEIVEYALP